MKVAFVGAQGSQKTTRVHAIAKVLTHFRYPHYVIEEVAREPGLVEQLSDTGGGFTFQMLLMQRQIWREQVATAHSNYVICDRSIIDPYCYALDGFNNGMRGYRELATIWDVVLSYLDSNPYSKIYWCLPKVPPVDDGVRSTCPDFQRRMVEIFDVVIRKLRAMGMIRYEVLT